MYFTHNVLFSHDEKRSSHLKVNVKFCGCIVSRYCLEGKVKTREMKVNCLLQAALGSLTVSDFPLQQDVNKIMRSAVRLMKCKHLLPTPSPVVSTHVYILVLFAVWCTECGVVLQAQTYHMQTYSSRRGSV